MDNDDNDFKSQSFQLASEENCKFLPGLRSYGLPKFDLDDNLQVHLRFDNLVETEVLLGIQSHEDNPWIEEFSREGSAIEFSSGAAKSCSISRHNNVWSEATSSESVEMLLKSVGQDVMIDGQTNNGAGPCNAVCMLTKEMEPHLDQDGSVPSILVDGPDVSCTLPPEDCHDSFSKVDECSNSKLFETENMLQSDYDEHAETGRSKDLSPVVGENWGLSVSKGNVLIDGINGDSSKRDDVSLVDVSVGKEIKNIAAASESMRVEHSTMVIQNCAEQQQVTDGCNKVITYERSDFLQKGTFEQVEDLAVPSNGPLIDDLKNGENKAETDADVVDNRSNLALNVGSAEGCSKDECSDPPINIGERQMVVLSKDTEMGDKYVGDENGESYRLLKVGIAFEGQDVAVNNRDKAVQSGTVLKTESLGQMPQEEGSARCFDNEMDSLTCDGHQLESEVSLGNSNATLSINEDGKHFNGQLDRSRYSHVENISGSMMELCSSANMLGESLATENIEESQLARVCRDDFSANDPLSSSMQRCESNLVIEPSVVSDSQQGLSVIEREKVVQICESSLVSEHNDVNVLVKENVRIRATPTDVKSEINISHVDLKGNATLFLGQEVAFQVSSPEQSAIDASGSIKMVSVDSNQVSYNKLDGVHDMPTVNGNLSDQVIEQKEDRRSNPCIPDFLYLDKKEELVNKKSNEPGSPKLVGCSRITGEQVHLSEVEQCEVHESAEELPPETVCQSQSSIEAVIEGSKDENQAMMVHRPMQGCSKRIEVHASDLNGNDGSDVVGVHHGNGTTPSNGEVLAQPGSPTLEGSLCVVSKVNDEGNKGGLASANKSDRNDFIASFEGQTVGGSEISLKPAVESVKSGEFHALEAENSNPSSEVPNCGSPTTISCSEPSSIDIGKQEGEEVSMLRNASEGLTKDARGSSSSDNPGGNYCEDDRSFTFKINRQPDVSDQETEGGWKIFGSSQSSKFVQAKEVPSTTSALSPMDSMMAQEDTHVIPQACDKENVDGDSKGTSEHKTKRSSNKIAGKERRSPKEVPPVKHIKDRDSPYNISPSSNRIASQIVRAEDMHSNSYVEGSARKVCSAATVQTSSLPDLDNSASPSALFQQPFTDLQQVQLRAQILVYGSLIQGRVLDEAFLISAFGESDGGRSLWENAWRAAVERLRNQNSPFSYPETPVHLYSGSGVHEQGTRQSPLQNRTSGMSAAQPGNKASSSAIINPSTPLPSPLWNATTPACDVLHSGSIPGVSLLDAHQTLSPLHSYQFPHLRHYVGNTAPWLSQVPCPGPWVVSPQTSTLDASARFSALPITETSHVISTAQHSTPNSAAKHSTPNFTAKHSTPNSLVHSGGATSTPAGTGPLHEAKRTASTGKQASADPRPRKRKTSLVSEAPAFLYPVPPTEMISSAGVTSPLPTSFAMTTAVSSLSKAVGSSVSTGVQTTPQSHQVAGSQDMEQRIIASDEMCNRVEQAKQQAEAAAALAAAAVRHKENIWSQLAIQKNAGLVSGVEAKLASAATTAAAAASVAKAAAAAAKVASDAALQAKLMADEALVSSRGGDHSQFTKSSSSDGVKSSGVVSPASIVRGKDIGTDSSSRIIAAKVNSRRRVESAAKQAVNFDALVKAAELAAEAVSQAGSIVAMGDPIPLTVTKLVEAGPDGFWKILAPSEQKLVKSSYTSQVGDSNLHGIEVSGRSDSHLNELSSNKPEIRSSAEQGKPDSQKNMARQAMEGHIGMVDGTHWDAVTANEKGFKGHKGCITSYVATVDVLPESAIGSRTDTVVTGQDEEHGAHQPVWIVKDNNIKEGSLVEVLSNDEGLRGVWFSAKVLSLKHGKAYVCYTDLHTAEGSSQLKQWVPLEGEGDKPPGIRSAQSSSIMKSEGTRKRRRGALGDHVWSVGDGVEAWRQNGWWEGIIMEKSKEDDPTFTVHFPARGDTSAVRAWHLRPQLVWKDGQWVCRSTENNSCAAEGDTPQEKRPRRGKHSSDSNPVVEARDRVTFSKGTGDSKPLALSEKEKVFAIGKNTRGGNGSDAPRTKSNGPQEEVSRVVFGVPKPGKKKKFMEVSKHIAGNDSGKLANCLMPQGSGRGSKNVSKGDPKGKQVIESKPKMIKSGRVVKSLRGKDNSSTSVVPASDANAMPNNSTNSKASHGQDGNTSEKQSLVEFGCSQGTHRPIGGPNLVSSLAHSSDAPLSKKKTSAVEPVQGVVGKGKNASAGEKLTKIGEKDATHSTNSVKPTPDAVEPRRSNRRIQPTSRLLEGLQSSLMMSKVPSVSHEKSSTKLQQRSGASSKGNNHG